MRSKAFTWFVLGIRGATPTSVPMVCMAYFHTYVFLHLAHTTPNGFALWVEPTLLRVLSSITRGNGPPFVWQCHKTRRYSYAERNDHPFVHVLCVEPARGHIAILLYGNICRTLLPQLLGDSANLRSELTKVPRVPTTLTALQ